ncbi:unnamed protein product [Cochlearia groenlandica]
MAKTKLNHFSHSCPLPSSETVADGICDVCFKEKPIEFTCKPCNFDLCKSCSELPQKVSHGFHSEHELEFCLFQYDRKPGHIICSGCGSMSSCSFYECKKCEIYLDLSCALLKNIVTRWDVKEMLHYSHEHLLRRCRPGSDARGSCLLCELPISPSSICYGCVYCYSFLHERCLGLPTQIQHPVHPVHSLIRLDFTNTCGPGKVCDACGLVVDGGVPFGCSKCDFNLHLRCADSLLRSMRHMSHEHKLFYRASGGSASKASCRICKGSSALGSYYYCMECDSEFHFECLEIPKSVFKRSCHVHPLVCKKLREEDDSLEYCDVCETIVHSGHHVYSCKECGFLGHIECILREVNDIKHNHVMRPVDICELSYKEDCCYICKKEILEDRWKCETCSFATHSFCAELGKPSRHRCHWNHLLTLLPKPLGRGMKMSCKSCKEDIKEAKSGWSLERTLFEWQA